MVERFSAVTDTDLERAPDGHSGAKRCDYKNSSNLFQVRLEVCAGIHIWIGTAHSPHR